MMTSLIQVTGTPKNKHLAYKEECQFPDKRHTSSDKSAKHRDYYGRPLRTVSATGSFEALLEINGSSEGLLRE